VYDEARRELIPYLGGINAFAVHFSPDRRSVVYINALDYTVWRARVDGSEAHPLTFAPWHVDALDWRPDGTTLAIRARAPGAAHTKIWLMSSGGGSLDPLDPHDVEQGSPSWAHDGTKLAFGDVPERFGTPTGSERIHIYDLATKATTDLAGSSGLWSSRWSPNGKYIAATTIADRTVMLYRVATGEWRTLAASGVDDLAWTRDSRYLYCDPEGPDRLARRIRIDDGNIEKIIDLRDRSIAHSGAGLSLDDRALFLFSAVDVYALELQRR